MECLFHFAGNGSFFYESAGAFRWSSDYVQMCGRHEGFFWLHSGGANEDGSRTRCVRSRSTEETRLSSRVQHAFLQGHQPVI